MQFQKLRLLSIACVAHPGMTFLRKSHARVQAMMDRVNPTQWLISFMESITRKRDRYHYVLSDPEHDQRVPVKTVFHAAPP